MNNALKAEALKELMDVLAMMPDEGGVEPPAEGGAEIAILEIGEPKELEV